MKGDGIQAVKERRFGFYDIIVCSGGDGTLDEVVSGMMQCDRRIPIGYVPAGSTNDFANSLHIPRDMIRAAEAIIEGKTFNCDIGGFNDDFFVYIAAFGLFTDVSYETPQDIKNVLGHMAYILEGMRRLPGVRSCRMKVESEEVSVEAELLPIPLPWEGLSALPVNMYSWTTGNLRSCLSKSRPVPWSLIWSWQL